MLLGYERKAQTLSEGRKRSASTVSSADKCHLIHKTFSCQKIGIGNVRECFNYSKNQQNSEVSRQVDFKFMTALD